MLAPDLVENLVSASPTERTAVLASLRGDVASSVVLATLAKKTRSPVAAELARYALEGVLLRLGAARARTAGEAALHLRFSGKLGGLAAVLGAATGYRVTVADAVAELAAEWSGPDLPAAALLDALAAENRFSWRQAGDGSYAIDPASVPRAIDVVHADILRLELVSIDWRRSLGPFGPKETTDLGGFVRWDASAPLLATPIVEAAHADERPFRVEPLPSPDRSTMAWRASLEGGPPRALSLDVVTPAARDFGDRVLEAPEVGTRLALGPALLEVRASKPGALDLEVTATSATAGLDPAALVSRVMLVEFANGDVEIPVASDLRRPGTPSATWTLRWKRAERAARLRCRVADAGELVTRTLTLRDLPSP